MDLFSELRNMKILLIDDDEWIRGSLSIFFESEGCYLTTVETAEEGLEALNRQNYDIILVDYRLPGIDGLEFLKRIQEFGSDPIKILITAYGSKKVLGEASKLGIMDYIEKPFTSDIIEGALRSLIEARNHKIVRD